MKLIDSYKLTRIPVTVLIRRGRNTGPFYSVIWSKIYYGYHIKNINMLRFQLQLGFMKVYIVYLRLEVPFTCKKSETGNFLLDISCINSDFVFQAGRSLKYYHKKLQIDVVLHVQFRQFSLKKN